MSTPAASRVGIRLLSAGFPGGLGRRKSSAWSEVDISSEVFVNLLGMLYMDTRAQSSESKVLGSPKGTKQSI